MSGMLYRVFSDVKVPKFLDSFNVEPWERPGVGDVITIKSRQLYVITKSERNTETPAPEEFEKLTTQDNKTLTTQNGLILIINEKLNTEHLDVSYDYFVTRQNRSPDAISLRYDADRSQRILLRNG